MTRNEIVKKLSETNSYEYNLLKAAEECSELTEVLLKKVTKKGGDKEPPDSAIVEEIGDVILRCHILATMFGYQKVQDRILSKVNKYDTYIKKELYKGKI